MRSIDQIQGLEKLFFKEFFRFIGNQADEKIIKDHFELYKVYAEKNDHNKRIFGYVELVYDAYMTP